MTSERLLDSLPAILGVLGAITGLIVLPALRLSRSLRRDLVSDAQIINELPKARQRELRNDMGIRAMLVVAYSRYQGLTRVELAAAFILIGLSVASLGNLFVLPKPLMGYFDAEGYFGTIAIALVQIGILTLAFKTWAQRTGDRLDYVRGHVDALTADSVAASTSLTVVLVKCSAWLLIWTPAAITFVVLVHRGSPLDAWSIGYAILGASVSAAFAVVTAYALRDRTLASKLPDIEWIWRSVALLGMDVPRRRVNALPGEAASGNTDEDDADNG